MNIVIIGTHPRSLINFRGPLLHAIAAKGHNVWACANENDDEVAAELLNIGVKYNPIPIHRAGLNIFADLLTFFHIFRLLRRLRPQIVLSYTIKPVIYSGIAAALCRVPRVYSMVTGLGYAFMELPGFWHRVLHWAARVLYTISLSKSSKVFFQNPDDIESFVKMGILQKEKAVLLNGSGVDLKNFAVRAMPREIHFLLIARLIVDKGIREYVQAARLIKRQFPQVRFLLGGDFDCNPSSITRDELQSWQDEKTIEYLGYLHDVRLAISNSSVYVLPSYREGTPRTVLEAMSMGRPIITSDAPGCRETVRNGENGFLVPVKSVVPLQQAMLKFIQDPELALRMGNRSRQIAEEKYDVHKVNTIILREIGIL